MYINILQQNIMKHSFNQMIIIFLQANLQTAGGIVFSGPTHRKSAKILSRQLIITNMLLITKKKGTVHSVMKF